MKLNKIQQKFVSENRQKPTIYETLMSLKLKVARIKFVTQYVIEYKDSFIICDFFIPKHNVIIEVDGLYHDSILQTHKDSERDRYLQSLKYNVIRIWNSEIDTFDTNSIKLFTKEKEPVKEPVIKKAVKAKYSLEKKLEDKKKLTKEQFRKKYNPK